MSAIKFRKRLTKFKITIALPKKFGSKGFITVVKVIKIWSIPFFPLAIVQWNALPETAVCSPDLESFKIAVSGLQHSRP